jgi:cyclase
MLKKRLIAVLILRDGQVVQSVRFKHTNVIHYDPVHAVECFNKWAVDEIVMLNVSPGAESRDGFLEAVGRVSGECFVPLAAGGWITDLEYARALIGNGADKLVLNTLFADAPDLVTAMSRRFGRQCIVCSMDARRDAEGRVEVAVDRARRATGIDPVTWARRAETLGAGEIFFNSVDHDGARKGYDLATLGALCQAVRVPVIAFGGVFGWDHLVEGLKAGADAVAVANQFHYTEHSTRKAKRHLVQSGVAVRKED